MFTKRPATSYPQLPALIHSEQYDRLRYVDVADIYNTDNTPHAGTGSRLAAQ